MSLTSVLTRFAAVVIVADDCPDGFTVEEELEPAAGSSSTDVLLSGFGVGIAFFASVSVAGVVSIATASRPPPPPHADKAIETTQAPINAILLVDLTATSLGQSVPELEKIASMYIGGDPIGMVTAGNARGVAAFRAQARDGCHET